jgi:hypothetical protein
MDELFADALGFSWDRAAVTTQVGVHTPERAVWHLPALAARVRVGRRALEGRGPRSRPFPRRRRADADAGSQPRRTRERLASTTEPGGENLRRIHSRGLEAIQAGIADPFEQALAYFLFASLQQFYFDGNKRTGRSMMNGHLMSHGTDAISVPAARRLEFNTSMVDFSAPGARPRCSASSRPATQTCTPQPSEVSQPSRLTRRTLIPAGEHVSIGHLL